MADSKAKKEYKYQISKPNGRMVERMELLKDDIKRYESKGCKVKKVEV